jgi:RND family efflux transporter MFP subunit
MKHAWLKGLLPIVIVGIAAAGASVMISSRPALPKKAGAVSLPVVEVMTSKPSTVAITLQSRGSVTPKRDIELVSEVAGKVVEVAPEFVEGGQVRQGATLLRIDPIAYEVARSEARAVLASARFSLAEARVVVMKAAIEEAQARVDAAEDRLRQAEADLVKTRIVAPFDAIIDNKRADLGQYIQTGTSVTRLLGTSSVEIRLPLLAADVPFVRYGQLPDGTWPRARLTARFGDIEHEWEARLVRMEQRVDEQTRVFYLVAEVDAPYDEVRHGRALSVGMFVQAEIQGTEIAEANRLPRSALHDGNHVYVVEQGVLEQRSVKLLRRDADTVIVGKGLEPGDLVLLSRLDLIVAGMPVAVEQ